MKLNKEQADEIDRLGHEWFCAKDQSKRLLLKTRLFEVIYQACARRGKDGLEVLDGDQTHLISEFYINSFTKFDETRGPLSHYLRFKLAKLEKDWNNKDRDIYRMTAEDGSESGKANTGAATPEAVRKVKKIVAPVSLDQENENGQPLGDTIAHANGERMGVEIMLDESLISVLTLMLELPARLQGKANNTSRLSYYPLFFTDDISGYIQENEITSGLKKRERDVLHAMSLPFLDFYMSKICRTLSEIQGTALRLYGELVEGGPISEPKQPLPWDVYISYFDRVEKKQITAPALSMQRKDYRTFLRKNAERPC